MTAPPKPLLVTMGDAAGIGPEIIVRAFQQGHLKDAIVVGDIACMRRAAVSLGLSGPASGTSAPSAASAQNNPNPTRSFSALGGVMLALIHSPDDFAAVPTGCLAVLAPPGLPAGLADLPMGVVDARHGAAAARCIEHAVRGVQAGQARGIVTAPIHKEAFAAAGLPYPGHTEMLQALATVPGQPAPPVRMMLANAELRVVLVTIHQSLRSAIDAVTFDAVLQTLRVAQQAAAGWQNTPPRMAVAGLNPHAGEGGLFGDEERLIIGPAVQAARAEGIDASGPFAPDTVFMRARKGEFDLVVAMTHDHGLIPVKYLGVEEGVNVTLGLPFVRTSPDHGTAFDIAGQAQADPASLIAALTMARRLTSQATRST
jgi:4-hydroxythreonine-4-phosphate dehydrogenase